MKIRPSSYIIRVDTHVDDQALLVHGYTKSIDLVSKRVADLLDDTERYLRPDELGRDQLKHLLKRGHLTTLSAEAEKVGFVNLVSKIDARKRDQMKPGFVLMPTYLCNLDCFYCYQKPAVESDAELVKHLMSVELADKAFEAYERLLPPGDTLDGGDLLLYGGEPLLRSSLKLLRHVVARARRHNMQVRAITNGTQLHHHKDLLGPDGIHWLQITLDGPRHIHDTRRITRGKKGSFDQIVDNIDLALSLGVKLAIRLNIDQGNLAALRSLDEFFVERGWYDHPDVDIYAAEVHMVEEQAEWVDEQDLLNPMAIESFIAEEGLRIRTAKGSALGEFNTVQGTGGFDGYKTGFCGANFGMCIFDAKGNVYSCWDEVELFQPVGHFHTGTVVYDDEIRRAWQRSPVVANPRCHECAYAFYCGGGCDWHGKKDGDEYYDHFCPDFMNSFRTAVAEDFAVSMLARERGLGERKADGGFELSQAQRAELVREVADKLQGRNVSACTFSCGSQKIKDEAVIHQKRQGLVQLAGRSESTRQRAQTPLVREDSC